MANRWVVAGVVAALGAFGGIVFVASCDGGGGTESPDARDDGGGTQRDESNPNNGQIADLVIDSMRIGRQEEGEGFNLDGLNTPPGHPYLPEDGPGGVDNQLGALIAALQRAGLEFDADAEIARSLAEGDLLILLSLHDVDDWSDDPGLVYLYGYAGKDADDPEDPTNNLTGEGELLVDERSLRDPNDLLSALIQFPDGILHDTTAADSVLQRGDFEAGPDLFTVDIPVQDGNVLHLSVNGTRIVFDIDTPPSGDPPLHGRMINGLIGGYILLADAARALSAIDLSGTSLDEATIRNVLAGQADMDVVPEGFVDTPCTVATEETDCLPGQTCEANEARGGAMYCYEQPETLDAISLGLVFTARSCHIAGIWHDTP